MSLYCHESEEYINFGEPLYAVTQKDINFFSALCQKIIDRIPIEDRKIEPCKSKNDGVDIHIASSTENMTGTYTLCDFALESFLFSISHETAKKYLPKFVKMLDRKI